MRSNVPAKEVTVKNVKFNTYTFCIYTSNMDESENPIFVCKHQHNETSHVTMYKPMFSLDSLAPYRIGISLPISVEGNWISEIPAK